MQFICSSIKAVYPDDCPARQVPSTAAAGSPTHLAWAEDRRLHSWRLCLDSVNNKRPHLVFGKLARSLKTIAWPVATAIDIGGDCPSFSQSVSQSVCPSLRLSCGFPNDHHGAKMPLKTNKLRLSTFKLQSSASFWGTGFFLGPSCS